MTTHKLKTWPESYAPIAAGQKVAEFRKDDRGFKVGDILRLREWAKETSYTGAVIEVEITHIIRGPDFGVPEGYVVMSLGPVSGEKRPNVLEDYITETFDMFKIFCEGRGLDADKIIEEMKNRNKGGD